MTPLFTVRGPDAVRQEQAGVPELVPSVSGGQRGRVGALDQVWTGQGLEQQQMGGVGLVPAGDEPVDHAARPVRAEDQLGEAAAGPQRPVGIGDALQSAHDGRSDRDDTATA